MKILSLTPAFFPAIGGIEQVTFELASRCKNLGISIDIAHININNTVFKRDKVGELDVYRIPLIGSRLIGLAPTLRKLASNYDLIHIHDPQLLAVTANAYLFLGKTPKILSTHGGFRHTSNYLLLKKIYELYFLKATLKIYDRILSSSVSDHAYFSKYSNKTELCGNGVDIGKFKTIKPITTDQLDRWIYWGRISKNKNISEMIDLISFFQLKGILIKLTICGSDFDNHLESLKSKVVDLNLGDLIHFKPSLHDEDLLNEISKNGVVLSASDHEGFGLTAIEAMSAGRIFICKNISPLNTFIKDRDSGFFLSYNHNPEDLSTIKYLLSLDETQINRMTYKAKTTSEKYDWNHVIQKFIEQFEFVLKSNIKQI